MIEWRDAAFVLTARRHGESAQIIELLTREHGRHLGLVRGGQTPKLRGVLQPGNEVAAAWRGRLAEHLGAFACEPVRAHAAPLLDDPDRLAGLAAAAALLSATLPEREPHGDVFAGFAALIAAFDSAPDWPARYVAWERDLLAALGFGLDLSRCAATGGTVDLAYVSPRTGRAVSRAAGLPYHDKLLPLPAFLWRAAPAVQADLAQGLELTGYFLLRHLLMPQRRSLPPARERLLSRLRNANAAAMMCA
jgi:DNA repair protein RecO (recombination protein O)